MKKKIIILIIFIIICIIPICVNAIKKEQIWKTVELSENELKVLNKTENTIIKFPLPTNKNSYIDETEEVMNNSGQYIESEPSEAEKETYKKWNKENEEFARKNNILNNLLNKYYPEEYSAITKMQKSETDGGISFKLDLTESQKKKTELIVTLYKEHELNNEEKEICKETLKYYYEIPQKEIKLDDELKIEIEKIINN